ncbi:MAG: hypothetical protein NC094_12130 [Bacteroidales bacterium]|nr:hypothetical protein [Lachnoclostridium sp.]MCM1385256.1 hypothetical protein [Lachnoclostridium sp.]MCM1466158.1 hypothetical protein [Bacteroidales bacterium]
MKFSKGIKVDGQFFDIPMVSLKRTADFLDKYAERTEDGELHRELIGVYYNYTLTVGTSTDFGDTDYDAFWEKMTEPVEFHEISIPTLNGYYNFTGYISSVSDEYKKILDGEAEFTGFTCKFTSKSPARTP